MELIFRKDAEQFWGRGSFRLSVDRRSGVAGSSVREGLDRSDLIIGLCFCGIDFVCLGIR